MMTPDMMNVIFCWIVAGLYLAHLTIEEHGSCHSSCDYNTITGELFALFLDLIWIIGFIIAWPIIVLLYIVGRIIE